MSTTQNVQNPWFGVSMALVGVIVGYGIALGTGGSAPADKDPAPSKVAEAPTPTPTPSAAPTADNVDPVDPDVDRIKGDEGATFSIIEYSDFECPFCVRHHPTLAKFIEDNDDVNWVYRHYPLSFHANAQRAAEASECAGDQGLFWEVADAFIDQGVKGDLVAVAESAGADGGEIQTCLDEGKYTQKVKDQMAAGSAAGVRGTPGNIVINNKTGKAKLVSGAQGAAAFSAAIAELK